MMSQSHDAQIKRLEHLYDAGEISYAEFEAKTRGLNLTLSREAARKNDELWPRGGGILGLLRRILRGMLTLAAGSVVIAGGAYFFFGAEFWFLLIVVMLAPLIVMLVAGLKDGF